MNYLIKLLAAVLFTLVGITKTTAQDYKPVEVDLGLRISSLAGTNAGGGFGLFLEPRYNINNKITVGLKLGIDALVHNISETGEEVNATILPSYILTGDYMLKNKKNRRFFVGLGLGFSGQNSIEFTATEMEGFSS